MKARGPTWLGGRFHVLTRGTRRRHGRGAQFALPRVGTQAAEPTPYIQSFVRIDRERAARPGARTDHGRAMWDLCACLLFVACNVGVCLSVTYVYQTPQLESPAAPSPNHQCAPTRARADAKLHHVAAKSDTSLAATCCRPFTTTVRLRLLLEA